MATLDDVMNGINDIKAKLDGLAQTPAKPAPAPPSALGTPTEPVSPNGTAIPWNAQAGEALGLVFQGTAQFVLPVPAGYKGTRELSLSQLPPQYDVVHVAVVAPDGTVIGDYRNEVSPSGVVKLSLDGGDSGQAYTVYIAAESPTNGAGRIQLVGGA